MPGAFSPKGAATSSKPYALKRGDSRRLGEIIPDSEEERQYVDFPMTIQLFDECCVSELNITRRRSLNSSPPTKTRTYTFLTHKATDGNLACQFPGGHLAEGYVPDKNPGLVGNRWYSRSAKSL